MMVKHSMDDRYRAWMIEPDGTTTGTEGTIIAVAHWAEMVIKLAEGDVTVKIERIEEKS